MKKWDGMGHNTGLPKTLEWGRRLPLSSQLGGLGPSLGCQQFFCIFWSLNDVSVVSAGDNSGCIVTAVWMETRWLLDRCIVAVGLDVQKLNNSCRMYAWKLMDRCSSCYRWKCSNSCNVRCHISQKVLYDAFMLLPFFQYCVHGLKTDTHCEAVWCSPFGNKMDRQKNVLEEWWSWAITVYFFAFCVLLVPSGTYRYRILCEKFSTLSDPVLSAGWKILSHMNCSCTSGGWETPVGSSNRTSVKQTCKRVLMNVLLQTFPLFACMTWFGIYLSAIHVHKTCTPVVDFDILLSWGGIPPLRC